MINASATTTHNAVLTSTWRSPHALANTLSNVMHRVRCQALCCCDNSVRMLRAHIASRTLHRTDARRVCSHDTTTARSLRSSSQHHPHAAESARVCGCASQQPRIQQKFSRNKKNFASRAHRNMLSTSSHTCAHNIAQQKNFAASDHVITTCAHIIATSSQHVVIIITHRAHIATCCNNIAHMCTTTSHIARTSHHMLQQHRAHAHTCCTHLAHIAHMLHTLCTHAHNISRCTTARCSNDSAIHVTTPKLSHDRDVHRCQSRGVGVRGVCVQSSGWSVQRTVAQSCADMCTCRSTPEVVGRVA